MNFLYGSSSLPFFVLIIYSLKIFNCHADKGSKARDRGEQTALLHYEKVGSGGLYLPSSDLFNGPRLIPFMDLSNKPSSATTVLHST